MSRDDGGQGAEGAKPAGMLPKEEAAAKSGQEEMEAVKTRNRLLLMSSAGTVILAALATVVLAQQDIVLSKATPSEQQGIVSSAFTSGTMTSLAAAPIEMAQADTQTKEANGNVPAAAKQQKTIFNEHADKAGITACKDVFPTLGFAAAAGSTFNATTSWSDNDPDRHSISSVVGMSFDTDQLKGSGASFVFSAPTPAKGGCEGTFVRVVPVAQDCKEFASSLPKDSKAGVSLQGISVITLPSGLETLLVPTIGKGCVVVTTSRAAAVGNE